MFIPNLIDVGTGAWQLLLMICHIWTFRLFLFGWFFKYTKRTFLSLFIEGFGGKVKSWPTVKQGLWLFWYHAKFLFIHDLYNKISTQICLNWAGMFWTKFWLALKELYWIWNEKSTSCCYSKTCMKPNIAGRNNKIFLVLIIEENHLTVLSCEYSSLLVLSTSKETNIPLDDEEVTEYDHLVKVNTPILKSSIVAFQ